MREVDEFKPGNVIVMWDGKWAGTYDNIKEATQKMAARYDGFPSQFDWHCDRDCCEFLEISQDQPKEGEQLTYSGWGKYDQHGNRYSFGYRVNELPNPLLTMEQPIMKLGEYFEQAIKEADWHKICNVYRQITGKYIEVPKPKTLVLADIDMDQWERKDEGKEILASPAEQEMEADGDVWVEEGTDEPPPPPSPPANDFVAPAQAAEPNGDRTSKRMARREPMNRRKDTPNEWNDDLTIASKELVTKHPELGVQNPRPRGEREATKVEVVCSMCGQKDRISPSLALGWHKNPEENTYKCNFCSTSKGKVENYRKQMR